MTNRFDAAEAAAETSDLPEADRLEQLTSASDEESSDYEEIGEEVPLEANEADAAEQSLSVPDDEEYPRD